MKKYVVLLGAFLSLSFQSCLGAAAAISGGDALDGAEDAPLVRSTFLNGLGRVTEHDFVDAVAPVFSYFIGQREECGNCPQIIGVGWAATNIRMIEERFLPEERLAFWKSELESCKGVLAGKRLMVSKLDVRIAEALYFVVYDEMGRTTYDEVESAIWRKLPSVLGISDDATKVDLKSLAAMKLWLFFAAIKSGIFPQDPSLGVASGDKRFLAELLNGLLDAYQAPDRDPR